MKDEITNDVWWAHHSKPNCIHVTLTSIIIFSESQHHSIANIFCHFNCKGQPQWNYEPRKEAFSIEHTHTCIQEGVFALQVNLGYSQPGFLPLGQSAQSRNRQQRLGSQSHGFNHNITCQQLYAPEFHCCIIWWVKFIELGGCSELWPSGGQ